MNVFNYFLLIFFLAFIIADVDCYPAKNRHGKSVLRHKKKGIAGKQVETTLKQTKRPKRHIPPELIARHHETLRCLRQYLQNQRLGIYQPYSLPIIQNPIRYQPNRPWTPNHRPVNNPGKIKVHNQVLKNEGNAHVGKKGVDFKQPGLSAHLEITRRGDDGVVGEETIIGRNRTEDERTTPGFHSFNITTAGAMNDYEVHEFVVEDDVSKGNHLTERDTVTTEEYAERSVETDQDATSERTADEERSLTEKEEFVTEKWESKKIQEEKEDLEKLEEPIDLLRITELKAETTETSSGPKVESEAAEFGRDTTISEARLFTEAERDLEATTAEARFLETEREVTARDLEATTISEARLLEVTERNVEATTSDARFLGTDDVTSRNVEAATARFLETDAVTSRDAEATTISEARFLEVESEVTLRNVEETTPGARFLESEDLEATTLSEARFLQTFRNVEETTPGARFLEADESNDLEATTILEARFLQTSRNVEETTPGARFLEAGESNDLEATTISDARFLQTSRNVEETTQEARLLETDESNDLEATTISEARFQQTFRNVEETTPEARFLDTDEATSSDWEAATVSEARLLDINDKAAANPEARQDASSYQETAISYADKLKQERRLREESPHLESNDIDQIYPGTESNDVYSYEEERTNFVGTNKPPTPTEINQILHIDQNPRNLTSLSQTIDGKRRSDILITDEYHEYYNETNSTTYPANFGPESLIQLIPVIIHDLRNKSVPAEDVTVLSEVFGKFWPVIQELSQNPNINVTELLNIKNEEDLQNLINVFAQFQEKNEDEDLEIAETESFSYSTIPNEPSLYDYVDDQQEVAYDAPDEIIEEEEKETPDFSSRNSDDFSNFEEYQSDFNGFESEDVPPETFAEQEYELAEDNSDGFYETDPSVLELYETAQAHDAVKNVRLPSSKPQFPESSFSDNESNDNFFL